MERCWNSLRRCGKSIRRAPVSRNTSSQLCCIAGRHRANFEGRVFIFSLNCPTHQVHLLGMAPKQTHEDLVHRAWEIAGNSVDEPLFQPTSASFSCAQLYTHKYQNTFDKYW